MNCFIMSVVSVFIHFAYPNTNIKDNIKLNLREKNHKKTYYFNDLKGELAIRLSTDIIFLEKIDSTKVKELKNDEVDKENPTEYNLKSITSKPKILELVTYRIFFDGRIEKHIPKIIKKGNEKKYKYVYYDKEGNKFDLGNYTVQKTQVYKGPKGKFVNLINLEEVPKYFNKKDHQYHFNIDSRRSFVNEKTLASFFGAMLEVNYLDISCNGFSHKDGSSRPSRSHINGNNGDFKYLREDVILECGKGTSLNISKAPDSLDYPRQNKWNDALYKFGWKEMLGWTYTIKKKTKYLHHITHKTTNHHHHLHVQNYEPQFKEIKQ